MCLFKSIFFLDGAKLHFTLAHVKSMNSETWIRIYYSRIRFSYNLDLTKYFESFLTCLTFCAYIPTVTLHIFYLFWWIGFFPKFYFVSFFFRNTMQIHLLIGIFMWLKSNNQVVVIFGRSYWRIIIFSSSDCVSKSCVPKTVSQSTTDVQKVLSSLASWFFLFILQIWHVCQPLTSLLGPFPVRPNKWFIPSFILSSASSSEWVILCQFAFSLLCIQNISKLLFSRKFI